MTPRAFGRQRNTRCVMICGLDPGTRIPAGTAVAFDPHDVYTTTDDEIATDSGMCIINLDRRVKNVDNDARVGLENVA